MYSSNILVPFKKKGSSVLSFHPIQSFSEETFKRNVKKTVYRIFWGVEGDKKGLKVANQLVSDMESFAIFIDKRDKILYHIACVFSSNYLLTLLDTIYTFSSKLKIKDKWTYIFLPLIITTLSNAFKSVPRKVLTGPIERGDLKTLKLHINFLNNKLPQILEFYSALAKQTALLALSKKSITLQKYRKILKIIKFKKK